MIDLEKLLNDAKYAISEAENRTNNLRYPYIKFVDDLTHDSRFFKLMYASMKLIFAINAYSKVNNIISTSSKFSKVVNRGNYLRCRYDFNDLYDQEFKMRLCVTEGDDDEHKNAVTLVLPYEDCMSTRFFVIRFTLLFIDDPFYKYRVQSELFKENYNADFTSVSIESLSKDELNNLNSALCEINKETILDDFENSLTEFVDLISKI
jgi:hypothetical protein